LLVVLVFLIYFFYRVFWSKNERVKWINWYWVFTAATLADILSTFFAVHIAGISWSCEQNYFARAFGPRYGYEIVLLCQQAIIAVIAYLFGGLSAKINKLIPAFCFAVASPWFYAAAIMNFFFGFLKIAIGF
jgi:hypothetical protein